MEIKRTGLVLTSNDPFIIGEGSKNIPVTVTADSSYAGYTQSLLVGWMSEGRERGKEISVSNDGLYYIPSEALAQNGPLCINIALDNGTTRYVCGQSLHYRVTNAPKDIVSLPEDESWKQHVNIYVAELIENGSVNLENYYTKGEVDKLINAIEITGGGTSNLEVSYDASREAIVFTGNGSGSSGSGSDGLSKEEIESLIDERLGVIENGSY